MSWKIYLIANPDKLGKQGGKGNVTLHYENRSVLPLTAAVQNLFSTDRYVASTAYVSTPLPPIHIPARPNKKSPFPPAKGSQPIGSWSPLAQGSATLNADVDVQDRYGKRLRAHNPSDDVQVT